MKSTYSHTRVITLLIALVTAMSAMSEQVSYEQALSTASDFFKSKGLNAETANLRRAKARTSSQQDSSPYYIINTDKAFAIVAGDSRVTPILAYSLDGTFDETDVPDGATYLLQMYEEYIAAVQAGTVAPQSRDLPPTAGKCLTTATWHQGWEPWWDKCPKVTYGAYTNSCWAGCVATAMSIIMQYHNWPEHGYGSKTYTTYTHGFECSADFSNTTYNISTIPLSGYDVENNSTPAQKEAIATLLYHAGVAASMDYDTSGSGASDMNAFTGICRYFGYNYGARAVRADYESDDDYILELVNEIDQDRPMLYSGQDASGGGHMFVCDGYDSDYKLHFNFGWAGNRNGYYSIFETDMTYYKWQQAIFGLYPNHDAASTEHPSIYFAESGDKVKPLSVNARVGQQYLNLSVEGLYNMTEGDIEDMYLRLYICDAEGNKKASILDWQKYDETGNNITGLSLKYNYIWTLSGYATIPSSYTYTEGDCIKLFYSEDNKATWHEVKKYGDDNYLDMAIFYDTTLSDLKMYNDGVSCPGLHLVSGNPINTTGTEFKVCPGNLYNYTYVDFDGDVAIFLCDSQDNPKRMVSEATSVQLTNNLYNNNINIFCTLLPEYNIKLGDRLVAFCRPTGCEYWSMITCDDPDKYYITIPASLIPTTQTVAFDGLFATFSSANDLDFSSIDSFSAYTVTLQDSETLLLNRITDVPAGEGVLLLGNNGDVSYSGTADILSSTPSSPDENLLVGVLEDTVVNNNDNTVVNFVFKTTPDIGFYQAEGETVSAGTAYMRISGAPNRAPLRFVFKKGEGQTGIFSVTADTNLDTTIYNLQGMKVTNPGPGIYIIGGKKVIIK